MGYMEGDDIISYCSTHCFLEERGTEREQGRLGQLTMIWALVPGTPIFASGANCIMVFAYSNGYVAAPSIAPAVAPATRDSHRE
jgi:hypothetical protein